MNILKPFRQAQLDSAGKEIYNYRISRGRHVVENAFGILSSVFRVYHTQINLEPENIKKVVMATCALHNCLMEKQAQVYAPPNSTYQENSDGTTASAGLNTSECNMTGLQRTNQGNICSAAKQLRNEFTSYFMNEGRVPWQHSRVIRNK